MKTASEAVRAAGYALAIVAIVAVAVPVGSAQRGSRTISLSRARSTFESMERAWRELRGLHVEPADANGEVATWDRRWAPRVARAEREAIGVCLDMLADELAAPADCGLHERTALFCNVGFTVSTRRRSIYDSIPEDEIDLPDEFDARRAIADEAARRRESDLSCEDLPDHTEIRGSTSSGWTRLDGTPLIPPSPGASVSPEGAVTEDTIAAFVERERPSLDRCWLIATRGMRAIPTVRLDVALDVGAGGAVTSVNVSGESIATLAECIQAAARRWTFPATGAERRASFPISFGDALDTRSE